MRSLKLIPNGPSWNFLRFFTNFRAAQAFISIPRNEYIPPLVCFKCVSLTSSQCMFRCVGLTLKKHNDWKIIAMPARLLCPKHLILPFHHDSLREKRCHVRLLGVFVFFFFALVAQLTQWQLQYQHLMCSDTSAVKTQHKPDQQLPAT